MQVVVAPDGFGGTLRPGEAAAAIADGWSDARPMDRVTTVPLSDGGEGLLDVLRRLEPDARAEQVEVAGPDARPRLATLLRLSDGTAVIETADVCGLALVAPEARRPLEATSYGVGQLLRHAVATGARSIVVGLGGTAVVDGGSGALNGLGLRLRTADGGLRIGATELGDCIAVEPGRLGWPAEVEVTLLRDTELPLAAAATRFAAQKGVPADRIPALAEGLAAWGAVVARTFPDRPGPDAPGTGAAGGLGFALAAALGARSVPGAAWVADRSGLDAAVAAADLVITGEGRLDGTSATGKVVSEVVAVASRHRRPVAAVVGAVGPGAEEVGIPAARVAVGPVGPDGDAAGAVRRATATLARTLTPIP